VRWLLPVWDGARGETLCESQLVTALGSPLMALIAVRVVSRSNLLTEKDSSLSAGIANEIDGFCDFFNSVPCRAVSQLFPSCFNELQRAAVTPCDMNATWARKNPPVQSCE
jgi:hypothetical protein